MRRPRLKFKVSFYLYFCCFCINFTQINFENIKRKIQRRNFKINYLKINNNSFTIQSETLHAIYSAKQMKNYLCRYPGGGGGGTQIWFRRGCAAEAAKPVPIFKASFWRKRVPIIKGP